MHARGTIRTRAGLRLAVSAVLILTAAPAVPQTIADERQALRQAYGNARAATARAADYERAASRATDDASRARRAQAATAARIQEAEAGIAAAQTRLRLVERLQGVQRRQLAEVQAPTVRLTAALQVLARRPAALALIQPGSIDDVVHVRALLAAGIPVIQARSAGVRAELARANRLRAQAVQSATAIVAGRDRLQAERLTLARAEADHRMRSARFVDSAMFEQDRAQSLGEQARDIVDLMNQLDSQAARRERLAALPGPIPRPVVPGLVDIPAAAPVATAGPPRFRLPVVGRVVTGLGEVSDAGIRARGVTLATAPGAQVVAPAAGRIAYAGPFRRYGRIVIVDHGGGWTTLLTGLATSAAQIGDPVDAGSPLGTAGPGRPAITIELRHAGRPVDLTPLLAG